MERNNTADQLTAAQFDEAACAVLDSAESDDEAEARYTELVGSYLAVGALSWAGPLVKRPHFAPLLNGQFLGGDIMGFYDGSIRIYVGFKDADGQVNALSMCERFDSLFDSDALLSAFVKDHCDHINIYEPVHEDSEYLH